jgi:hypothetical protein
MTTGGSKTAAYEKALVCCWKADIFLTSHFYVLTYCYLTVSKPKAFVIVPHNLA